MAAKVGSKAASISVVYQIVFGTAAGDAMFSDGKVILAPMVRIGTLPTRLLAIHFGADYVFTPETIDRKLSVCTRHENPHLHTIDYLFSKPAGDTELVLRLHRSERDRVVLQLGTADAQCALRAARLVAGDVCGVDVNSGCPKRFSVKGGMGAALLREPQRLADILRTLVDGLPGMPVSCKIRVLPRVDETLEVVRTVAQCGIHALIVHPRTAAMRYDVPADWNILRLIRQHLPPSIALVLSGDISRHSDIQRARSTTGCDSVMLARAAQHNLSVFAPVQQDLRDVSRFYLETAHSLQNPLPNTKYCLIQSWIGCEPRTEQIKTALRKMYSAKAYDELYAALGFDVPERLANSASIPEPPTAITHAEDMENGYTCEQQDAKLLQVIG